MKKGSVMVYTLMVLTVLLVISVTIISVNTSQTKSAIATDESVVAFFLAESGAEIMLDRIYSGTYNNGALSGLLSGLSSSTCSNGVLTGNNISSGTWTVTFYDEDRDQLSSCSSTTWRTEVDEMKIDGNHSNTIRSIRMSVKPAS